MSELEYREVCAVEQTPKRNVEHPAELLQLHDPDVGTLTALEPADHALGDVQPLGKVILVPRPMGAQRSHVRSDRPAQLHSWTVDRLRL
jgi:hypothetical protein